MNIQPPATPPANIAFIDLAAQRKHIGERMNAAIQKAVEGGAYIMGPQVKQLEDALSDFCGARHTITCANGTDALSLALMALGVGEGDAVFVPSFTFAATAEVVPGTGATPVFVDVDERTFNMDGESLKRAIEHSRTLGLKPAGVIPVDLFGLPADYDAIETIADKKRREAAVSQDVVKYAVLSSVLALNPIPFVAGVTTDILIIALQVKMVRDIGQYFGHRVDKAAAKSLMAGLGLGTGFYIGTSNLLKLFVGIGSVWAAGAAFATTWALGEIAFAYFDAGAREDFERFKEQFNAARQRGKTVFLQHKDHIEQAHREKADALSELGNDFKDGNVDVEKVHDRIADAAQRS